MRRAALAGCLALSGSALLPIAGARDAPAIVDSPELPQGDLGQHLAVVVPVYRGDLSRAVSSLERWPSTCSALTERNADLVLYYAEGEEDAPAVDAAVETINKTAGSCFSKTRLVYAHLSEEEDVYPKGPSVMFFKMFLDEGVQSDLSEYDALAIIEWDVLVASDRSFEELHHAAFRGNEDFWVKGSNLGGTNFHSTAQASEMWNVLGHINGNAIYNNNDPAFVEYVDYTRTRWEYTYPYDVALWLTISDFPYSWPLWQRYSSKFVTTNLISYVGYEHVDHTTVSDAVAGQTLFIHGSRVEEGNLASLRATNYGRTSATAAGRRLSDDTHSVCHTACGSADTDGLPAGTSTVCDDTCDGESARFGGFLCGAGDSAKFGSMCRLCYTDVDEARREEQSLALARPAGDQEASHVIMCDTMRPPHAADCSDKCGRKEDTVCDEACGTGLHGDYNCNWRDHGPKCRFCFDDLKTALLADNVAQRRGGRVIMCSTFEPPQAEVVQVESQTEVSRSRKLQAWRENEKWKNNNDDEEPKWKTSEKWKNNNDDEEPKWKQNEKWKNNDDEVVPKWRENEKWKNNFCDEDDCPHTNSNGIRGRVCDDTCADGDPYGTFGCGARDGAYGDYCRVCYFDVDTAIANDSADERAIMCDTVLPVESVYSRLLATTVVEEQDASNVAQNLRAWKDTHAGSKRENRKLQAWRENEKWKNNNDDEEPKWKTSEKWKNNNDDEEPKWKQNEKWKNNDDEVVPKWRENEKWKNNFCDEDDCPHTNSNGIRGRVCDDTCADGDPYGTFGCGARDGAYGDYCRVCYFDQDTALDNDSATERAIMCDTVLPVEGVYSRLLATTVVEGEDASNVAQNLRAWKDTHAGGKRKNRKLQAWRENEKWKNNDDEEEPKWKTSEKWKNNNDDEEPKWKQNEKWKNNDDEVVPKWRENEKWKNNFCDEDDCPHTNSNGIRGRVCDETCADGDPYGTLGCGARDGAYGDYCRVCYFDVDTAIANDSADERAIMCETVLPVTSIGPYRRLTATTETEGENASNVAQNLKAWKDTHAVDNRKNRKLQAWRENEKWKNNNDDEEPKWKTSEKWKNNNDDEEPKWKQNEKWKNNDDEVVPKWKENEKWKNNFCDEDDCPHTNSNGIRGRVCDDSCADGDPYGTFGCGARDGAYGDYCRVCYFDQDTAIANDSADERAIMCDTVLPVEGGPYRRLTATTETEGENASNVAQNLKAWKDTHAGGKRKNRKLQAWRENEKWKNNNDDEEPKWKTSEKWKNNNDDEEPKWKQNEKWKNNDDEVIPKWKENEKWKNNFCDEDDCPHTNSNGIRGRVCDDSCADGDPYGTFGCGARDGAYGDYCRVCYFDQDTALANDSATERAIMCLTVLPVEGGPYRRLTATTGTEGENASNVAQNLKAWKDTHAGGKRKNRKLQAWRENEKWKNNNDDEEPKWKTSEKWKNNNDDEEPKWKQNEKWKNNDDEAVPKWRENEKWKNNFCDEDDCPHTNSNGIRGRVCDDSCADGDPYGTFGCGARDGAYGDYCRVCYFDQDTALANDSATERAIMCLTVLPVEGGPYRRLTATTETEGENASNVAQNLKAWKDTHAGGKRKNRKLQAWKENEKWKNNNDDEEPKWKTSEKWKNNNDDEEPKWKQNEKWKNNDDEAVPKWRENEKWKNNFCDEDDCPHTNSNGIRGRVCDDTCADGDPYGTFGCGARNGAYGDYCRVCYFDEETAIANDSATERAIMCETVLPVQNGPYRRLTATTATQGEIAENVSQELKAWKGSHSVGKKAQRKRKNRKLQNAEAKDAQSMFAEATVLPYVNDLVRGNLCAFVSGHLDEVDQVEVAVMSVLQFLPGMRVAVAADSAGFDAYDRAVGVLPGVTVHSTKDPITASLFADEFCGADTSLIFYMKPGSIVSRQFISKDTHSTHGDLLVVHGAAKASFVDRELAKQTTAVLGFEAPSFTFNTDLFLPVGANAELREVLASGEGQGDALEAMEGFLKLRNMSAVPQVMAALAYSRNTPGVWFIDPQTWVSQHLFRAASIWEIPLVKPHYTCSIDPAVMKSDAGNINVALILQSNLDFFTHGGTCDNGFIDVGRGA